MASEKNESCLSGTSASANQSYDDERMSVSEDDDPTAKIEVDTSPVKDPVIDCGRGVAISDLRDGRGNWGPPPLPTVHPSANHAVLYKVPWKPGKLPEPYPRVCVDRWDQDHVRMPNSSESLYPVQETGDEKGLRLRWELVQEALLRPISNSRQLEAAILSYNSRYNERWNFRALHILFEEVLDREESEYFFREVLPAMAVLALQLPELVTSPIPLLKKHKDQSISLSQVQIASLLANAFFCTFPRRNSTKRGSEYAAYPDINFNRLFQCGDNSDSNSVLEKLKCILNYFRRICLTDATGHEGVVTFSRRFISPGSFPNWSQSTKPLPKMHITSHGFIEDEGCGMLQVDFANKYVGGGVLGWGCVQEEIRFVICPELILSRLFTECLDATEALLIVGCERFSKYSGYGHTFEWLSDFRDDTPLDSFGRRHCSIVAMDALCFSKPSSQFFLPNLVREVNKAYVGFCETEDNGHTKLAPVATGNWGCGAFRGDANVKALLQLVAAGEASRAVVYFTFGDEILRDRIYGMYKFLMDNHYTVGKLWSLLTKYSRLVAQTVNDNVPDLYDYIYSSVLQETDDKECNSGLSLKPSEFVKRKVQSQPGTPDGASGSSSAGTGLTVDELDSLIEDFESDDELCDELEDTRIVKKMPVQAPSSISCLNMIEESLGKHTSQAQKSEQKSSTPLRICESNSKSKSTSKKEAFATKDNDKSIIPSKPSEGTRTSVADSSASESADPTMLGDDSKSASSVEVSAETNVNIKRTAAPKRKISDYFSPV
ncbi:Poly(ADP-ribose) glycohydrolase [Frankliniella fusca]|uniref:poly(ADP-ribose) glycohydrolase n=1 Tax=Frankliniella fusca TaxID=407009 RepID=A0AAE1I215_9NEOP|nr:Poly(ADP-ribose) glycohydrolase [Frankliniella fusca]